MKLPSITLKALLENVNNSIIRGAETTTSTTGPDYPTRKPREIQEIEMQQQDQSSIQELSDQERGKVTGGTIPGARALRSLEAKIEVLTSQPSTDISLKAVSEKVASEVERTSEEWVTGRVVSEAERGNI